MEPAQGAIVDPITEEELAKMAANIKTKMIMKFGRDRMRRAFPDEAVNRQYFYETFLALRMYFHRKAQK